jgi:glutathione S-transferase
VFAALNSVEPPIEKAWLGDHNYLESCFTAGDLLMTTVLRILRHTDMVSGRPALNAYQERCEARPAFRKAMAHHLKPIVAGAA